MKEFAKLLVIAAMVCSRVGWAQEAAGGGAAKRAADLSVCANGHRELKDVVVSYGYGCSPQVEAKVVAGEAILGGCVLGPRDHWVYCKICGLCYDDGFSSWRDDRWLFLSELYLLRSDTLRKFPVEFGVGSQPERFEYKRWFRGKESVGEQLGFWIKADENAIVAALKKWLPESATATTPAPDPSGRSLNSWNWQADGKDFNLRYLRVFNQKAESHLEIEWHQQSNSKTNSPP